jgi:DNA processing protein
MILSALPGLGPVRIGRLDQAMGGRVERLLDMSLSEREHWCRPNLNQELNRWPTHFDPGKVLPELERMGADFVTFEEEDYPARLRNCADRPVGLYRYLAGRQVPERSIAIVGTRRPSSYGRKVARDFATTLSKRGFCVVSGLAEGIDTEAHRAALREQGGTLAVLGGGLNRCYPASNRGLLELIRESAGVWSEFPLWRRADRRSFPQRNRIVSGISEAVVVIESGPTGGSLITARMASEQGKPVYVVPGRIDSPESTGCHALIRDGAQLVTCVEDILDDLSYLPGALLRAVSDRKAPCPRAEPELEGTSQQIWNFIGRESAAHVDRIANGIGASAAEVSRCLQEMEVDGLLCRRLDGCFERA